MGLLSQARSFPRPVQLLLVNQLTINLAFYLLMPYLAMHLADDLRLAGWAIGLVLGVRNLSQQGMFLLGGSLADRVGYKPPIVAGLALRTVGFGLLGFAGTLPVVLAGALLTGLAGALFNPAVRAYLASEAPDRRVEAFAVFNAFYQLGMLAGPLVGLALIQVDFRLACLVAAALFAWLTWWQARALPPRRPAPAASATGQSHGEGRQALLADWSQLLGNRVFVWFALAMIGAYVLSFQVYLALPLAVRQATGSQTGVSLLFVVSAALAFAGQVRVTAWCTARWEPAGAITRGLIVLAMAFVPLLLTAHLTAGLTAGEPAAAPGLLASALRLAPALVATALLSLGTMIAYPFEMATIMMLADQRLASTAYGLYSMVTGLGIVAGNLLGGTAFDLAERTGVPQLPWLGLTLLGAASAAALFGLDKAGRLTPTTATAPAALTAVASGSASGSASHAGAGPTPTVARQPP